MRLSFTSGSKDRLLLGYFRADGRVTLTELSRITGIPVSSIFERLKAYRGGIVHKFTALVDFQQLGLPIRTSITIRVDKNQREDVREYLLNQSAVNSLFKINNGYDFLFEALFPNVREVEEFMERLDGKFIIHDRHTYYIIDELKREGYLCHEPPPVPKG